MISEPIYKRDSKGKIRVWTYEVDGPRWRTHSGLLDGTMTTSGWTTCTPKSRPTAEEQALFEAEAERSKKLARDYRPSLREIDRPRGSRIKPMLAQKYETFPGPCYIQPKLDGIRCIATSDGLWTRQGKPITSCPHIEEALRPHFEKNSDLILDGELYNHFLKDDFNAIVSAVRKADPTPECEKLVQYHVYDMYSDGSFGTRFEALRNLLGFKPGQLWTASTISLVPTTKVADEGSLDFYYGTMLEEGYEGLMVRLDGPYEQKRSSLLLKRKEFQDAEYKVIRIEEGNGNWAGYAKRAVLQLPDGREFGAGIKGNQDYCRQLLDLEFEMATVRYFALTPDGVPRFPVVVDFFNGDRA